MHSNDHQDMVAQLSFLFSLERGEIADEMGISLKWTYGLISEIYERLGLKELLSGELTYAELFSHYPQLLEDIQEQVRTAQSGNSVRNKETLAFHILTMPDISETRP